MNSILTYIRASNYDPLGIVDQVDSLFFYVRERRVCSASVCQSGIRIIENYDYSTYVVFGIYRELGILSSHSEQIPPSQSFS